MSTTITTTISSLEFAYYRPSFLELPDVCDHLGLVLIRAGTD